MAKGSSVEAYLATLPAERRSALTAVRAVINEHLPRGFEEKLVGKMIAWSVPRIREGLGNEQTLLED